MENREEIFDRSQKMLRGMGFHTGALLAGKEAIRSKLADLKLDRALSTETENTETSQLQALDDDINMLEDILKPSSFSPDADPSVLVPMLISIKLSSRALWKAREEEDGDWNALLGRAVSFLQSVDGRIEAAEYITPHLNRPGILLDDIPAVLDQAVKYLYYYCQ